MPEPVSYYRFRNEVPVDGYVWVSDWERHPRQGPPFGDGPFLVVAATAQGSPTYLVNSTYPLRDTVRLYRTFAGLSCSEDAAVAFANKYGSLDTSDLLVNPWIRQETGALSWSFWIKELRMMKIALHLWDALCADDHRELRKYVHWRADSFDGKVSIVFRAHGFETIGRRMGFSSLTYPDFPYEERFFKDDREKEALKSLTKAAGWDQGNVRGPARLTVQRIINERLERYCHPRLYLGKNGKHIGWITPINLVGCLWLQFYQEVSGLRTLRKCAICHKEMDVTENRSHKAVHPECSKRLRDQRYREKMRAQRINK